MTDYNISTWQTHCRHIQSYIKGIPAEVLAIKFGRGRTMGAILAHLQNNRLTWLAPSARDLAKNLMERKRLTRFDLRLLSFPQCPQ